MSQNEPTSDDLSIAVSDHAECKSLDSEQGYDDSVPDRVVHYFENPAGERIQISSLRIPNKKTHSNNGGFPNPAFIDNEDNVDASGKRKRKTSQESSSSTSSLKGGSVDEGIDLGGKAEVEVEEDEEKTSVKTSEPPEPGVQTEDTNKDASSDEESDFSDASEQSDDIFIGLKFIDTDEQPPLGSCEDCYKGSSKLIKAIFSILLTAIMLGCLLVSKGCLLFISSQMHPDVTFTSRNNVSNSSDVQPGEVHMCMLETDCIRSINVGADEDCQEKDNVRWIWAMYICQCTPYMLMFLRCAWKMCFKSKNAPDSNTIGIVMVIESLHCVGIFMLMYVILPVIDVFRALLLCTAVAILPAFLQIFNTGGNPGKKSYVTVVDTLAFLGQFSAFLVWPIVYGVNPDDKLSHHFPGSDGVCDRDIDLGLTTPAYNTVRPYYENETQEASYYPANSYMADSYFMKIPLVQETLPEYMVSIYMIPLALLLCSLTYWENFLDIYTWFPGVERPDKLLKFRVKVRRSKTKLYALMSMYKIVITFAMLLFYYGYADPYNYPTSTKLSTLFDEKSFYKGRCGDVRGEDQLLTDWLEVTAIQVCVGLISFYAADLAIKGHMQVASYTIPLVSSTPLAFLLLFWACKRCHAEWDMNIEYDYYWNCFQGYSDMTSGYGYLIPYIGVVWWLSQLWVSRYLWFSKVERLAKTDKIFMMPMYCGVLLEQSLCFIRQRNDEENRILTKEHRRRQVEVDDANNPIAVERPLLDGYNPLFMKDEDKVTPFVIMCATIWHENEREMIQILHSIIRTDCDAAARKRAKELNPDFVDPDFYEFELNMFFDDAFTPHLPDELDYTINSFVIQLMDSLDAAAKMFFGGRTFTLKPPDKYVTPYGGRLVFELPFGNSMVIHLKDKQKIRNRKRWSQVMYLHYLLGQGIVAQPFGDEFQEIVARNTYILALDGDVDFKPEALILLLDLMKRNEKVAAACGRIHPLGAGPMVWYQKFEYSLSHWLQKSTEHVLGCVLCSPGCFSLFRCSALMDDNVVQRYSIRPKAAREHVQYDQGEDRWLCTLLLQQGHRVEYSAASDAYTYAPEEFKEFYNQRRRWITSTFANIMDLLESGRYTAKKNENISMLYIIYQAVLFGSSILGPATIFLLVLIGLMHLEQVGAVDTVFGVGLGIAVVCGAIPLFLFGFICYTCSNDTQVKTAAVLSAIAAVLQTFVLIGLVRQMVTDGVCSPQSFFFLFVMGVFILAAFLHPQEGANLAYIPIYFLLVPCMYLILMIFSLCNINSVSWGTREVKVAPSPAQLEAMKKAEAEAKKKQKAAPKDPTGVMGMLGLDSSADDSGYSIGCGSCCKLSCCGSGGQSQADVLDDIKDELITLQLQVHDLKVKNSLHDEDQFNPMNPRFQSVAEQYHELTMIAEESFEDEEEERNEEEKGNKEKEEKEEEPVYDNIKDPRNMKWLKHERLVDGEYKTLGQEEMQFWNDLIKIYLYPLDANKEEQKKVGDELKELRNTVVFGFFLIDILLIVTILGLSLTIAEVPEMAIKWNCSVGGEVFESQMDPIGFLFIFVFGFIMVIQLCGMFLHRVFTFLQIVSVTILCGGSVEGEDGQNMSSEEFIELIKQMQMPDLSDTYSQAETFSSSGYDSEGESVFDHIPQDELAPITGDNTVIRQKTVVKKIKTKQKPLNYDTIGRAFATNVIAMAEEIDEQEDVADRDEEANAGHNRRRLSMIRHNGKSMRIKQFQNTVRGADRNRSGSVFETLRARHNITQKDIDKRRGKVREMLPRDFRKTTRGNARERAMSQRERAFSNASSRAPAPTANGGIHHPHIYQRHAAPPRDYDMGSTREPPQDYSLRLDSTRDESSDTMRTVYPHSRAPLPPLPVMLGNSSSLRRRPGILDNQANADAILNDEDMGIFEMKPSGADDFDPPADYDDIESAKL